MRTSERAHTSQRQPTPSILIWKLKHEPLRIMIHGLNALHAQSRKPELGEHHGRLV